MFLDDLLNGSRKQLAAPFNDVILFTRDWGFQLDEVKVPVRWWHGDSDHIVPFAHGQHVVSLLPDAELFGPVRGKAIWAGLGRGEEILVHADEASGTSSTTGDDVTGTPAAPTPAKPPISRVDLVISIVALVLDAADRRGPRR